MTNCHVTVLIPFCIYIYIKKKRDHHNYNPRDHPQQNDSDRENDPQEEIKRREDRRSRSPRRREPSYQEVIAEIR
jgi:hypothetical protein